MYSSPETVLETRVARLDRFLCFERCDGRSPLKESLYVRNGPSVLDS